jgi:hypothetical protein
LGNDLIERIEKKKISSLFSGFWPRKKVQELRLFDGISMNIVCNCVSMNVY